jgi:phosphoribosylamine--glycine ligase
MLDSDLLPALHAAAHGSLAALPPLHWRPGASATVMLCARGYPGAYATGSEIFGLDEAGDIEGVTIFHAGTMADQNGILANGGRVLAVNAVADDLPAALQAAYAAIDTLDWADGFCRRDIGKRAIHAGMLRGT